MRRKFLAKLTPLILRVLDEAPPDSLSPGPAELMRLADEARTRRHGRKTYFVHSLNINPTNICENECELCAFWRADDAEDAYSMDLAEATHRMAAAAGDGESVDVAFGTEVEVTKDASAADTEHKSAESAALTAAGTIAAGDTLYFNLARKVGDAADDLDLEARLHGLRLYYATEAATDD